MIKISWNNQNTKADEGGRKDNEYDKKMNNKMT